MAKKDHFIEKVSHLFIEYGAKTFTMDDIAKEFSMSKKTLYQQFKNKDELLEAVLDFQLEQMSKGLLLHIKNTDTNPIQKFLMREEKLNKMTEANKNAFIKQLKKYYPELYNRQVIKITEVISEILINNIEKGRAEGLYRTDFDAEQYAKYFLLLAFSYDESPILEKEQEDHNLRRCEYSESIINFYLDAIMTEKGREVFQKSKKEINL